MYTTMKYTGMAKVQGTLFCHEWVRMPFFTQHTERWLQVLRNKKLLPNEQCQGFNADFCIEFANTSNGESVLKSVHTNI